MSSSRSDYIPTPEELRGRKCLLNIENRDLKSFLYCIAASYHTPKRNLRRPKFYQPLFSRFNMDGISIPVKLEDIPRFEKQNNMCVNVFKFSKNDTPSYIRPVYQTSDRFKHVVNLIVLKNADSVHYMLIKCLATFLKVATKHGKSRLTCEFCYRVFASPQVYLKHSHFCETGEQSVDMPEDPILKFKNFKYKIPNPVTIYADFEAYNCRIDVEKTGKTRLISEQKPTGFGYTVVSPYPGFSKPTFVYRGPDASDYFVEKLLEECFEVFDALKKVEKIEFTDKDEELYNSTEKCTICNVELDWENDTICRDHCHITGSFRGAAHQHCNIMMQQQKRPIIYFHNAKGYDNHFLIKSLASNPRVGAINVLGHTSEKYTRISCRMFIIQDSMSHLIGSLDNLSSSLRQHGLNGFGLVRQEFPLEEQFQCCLRKLVYPYDYIDGFDRFNERIPDINAFYNKLSDEELAEEEYNRMQEVCEVFNITTLGELHDLYLQIDVLILACVFEDYRRLGLAIFGLDPAFYVSSPSYSFDAMLHTTGVELELLSDHEMYKFFEKG